MKRLEPKTNADLRAAIITAWQKLDGNKDMLRKMMESIPARMMACINRGGRQVAHRHYKPYESEYK